MVDADDTLFPGTIGGIGEEHGARFPAAVHHLRPDDWTSGDKIWLLDLIAPSRQLATAVLANFKQIAGDKPVAIHPIVARSVDAQVLEKMRVKGE